MPAASSHLSVTLGGVDITLVVSEDEQGDRRLKVSVADPAVRVAVADRDGSSEEAAPEGPGGAQASSSHSGATAEEPSSASVGGAQAADDGGLPPVVRALALRLRSLGGWTPEGRARRALELGRSDGEKLELAEAGARFYQKAGETISGASKVWYCVLRPAGGGEAFCTKDRALYRRAAVVGDQLGADGITRAFATEAEARIYFVGAELPWRQLL